MKQIQIADIVNVLNKNAGSGPHISILLGQADLKGKRMRSVDAVLRTQINEAEYLLKKSGQETDQVSNFRKWVDEGGWLKNDTSEYSHAFFIHGTDSYWLKVPGLMEMKSEVVVSETWHMKSLLNYLTKADAKIIQHALKSYRKAEAKKRTTDALNEVTQYALNGQVKTLLISNARKVWGELDRWTGRIRIHGKQENARDDDLLDDLAEIVMSFKGRVLVVPDEAMPTASPIAAII